MSQFPYTLGRWKIRAGCEQEFLEAWGPFGEFFLTLPAPPLEVTLLRDASDPTRFYSFGRWQSLEDIAAMRRHPEGEATIARLSGLCEIAEPGIYDAVWRLMP